MVVFKWNYLMLNKLLNKVLYLSLMFKVMFDDSLIHNTQENPKFLLIYLVGEI